MKRLSAEKDPEVLELSTRKLSQMQKVVKIQAQAEKIAKDCFYHFQLKKKVRQANSVPLEAKHRIRQSFKGFVVMPKQVKLPMEEIYKNGELRKTIIRYLMEETMMSPLEFIFLLNVLRELDDGVKLADKKSRIVKVIGQSPIQLKRYQKFLEDRAKQQESKSKKVVDRYQEEVKNKIKLVSMIGGQIYKRISDRVKLTEGKDAKKMLKPATK